MYRDFGVKKGFWKRVRGSLVEYVNGQLTFELMVTAISEEPRARGEELWDIFTSTRLIGLNTVQTRLLDKLEGQCMSLGLLPLLEV